MNSMPGSSFDILCIPSCSFLSISHLILLLSDPDADSSSQVRSLPPSLPSAQTVPASPKMLPASYLLLTSSSSASFQSPLYLLCLTVSLIRILPIYPQNLPVWILFSQIRFHLMWQKVRSSFQRSHSLPGMC